MKGIIGLLLCVYWTSILVQAETLNSAKVLEVSSSGKSIVLAVGEFDGVKVGDRAYFSLKKGKIDLPYYDKIGTAEALKVFPDRSFWLFKDISYRPNIYRNDILSFFKSSKALNGRRPFKTAQKQAILGDKQTIESRFLDNQKGIPRSLVKEEDDFTSTSNHIETKELSDADINVTTYDEWVKSEKTENIDSLMADLEVKRQRNPGKRVSTRKIKKDENDHIFDSMVSGIEEKYKSPKDLKNFYETQTASQDRKLSKDIASIDNSFRKYARKKREKSLKAEKFVNKNLKRDGELWSSDFDDKSLRKYMVETGIEEEWKRQRKAITQVSDSNEIVLRVGNGIADHSTSQDASFQGGGYGLGVGYEFHFSRIKKEWMKYSFEIYMDRYVEYYDLGGINGKLTGGSFSGSINYYLKGVPNEVNKLITFIGAGYKRGSGDIGSANLSTSYEYTIQSLPILHIGAKYRWKTGDGVDDILPIGLGVNTRLSYELITLTPVGTVNESDPITGSTSYNDINLVFGLSIYF